MAVQSIRFVVVGAVTVALAAAAGIFTLDQWAARNARAALTLVELSGELNAINALEWQAIGLRQVDADLDREMAQRRQRAGALLDSVGVVAAASDLFGAYGRAVEQEFALIRAGDIEQAIDLDETLVDPTFAELSRVIAAEAVLRRREGERASAFANVGEIVASLSALALLGGLFVRFHQSRLRQARELAARDAQLRKIAGELTLVEERERRYLAQELHDHLSQILAAIKIRLTTLGPDVSRTPVADILALVDQADRSVRDVSLALSPPILRTLGLMPTLEWLGEEIERMYGVRVGVTHDCKFEPVLDERESLIYRIVRELLINVGKHAETDHASVACRCDAGVLTVRVSDSGRGFDPTSAMNLQPERGGFGLQSIFERVLHLGGTLEIDSAPGAGCRVTLTFPAPPGPAMESA